MTVLSNMTDQGHEQVVYFNDPRVGLKAIVAIHDTTLGPSLGGCRMWNYQSEEEALIDVLRLSKGMTYKAAIAGLKLIISVIFINLYVSFPELTLICFGQLYFVCVLNIHLEPNNHPFYFQYLFFLPLKMVLNYYNHQIMFWLFC